MKIADPRGSTLLVDEDASDHAVGTNLDAMGQRVGDMGDERRRFGVDVAALQTEPAVDAMRPIAESAVADRDGTDPHAHAEPAGAALEQEAALSGKPRLPQWLPWVRATGLHVGGPTADVEWGRAGDGVHIRVSRADDRLHVVSA